MELNLRRQATAAFVALAEEQAGVLRREQLVGVTAHVVEAQLTARRWRAHGPNLVVLHNGELTQEQKLWAAVLNADARGRAGLAAWTAAEAHGLTGWSRPVIHVVVQRGTLVAKVHGLEVKVHESRRFEAERDLHPAALPPRTRVERSLIDSASWSTAARSACGVLAAGVQQRLTTAERLQAELGAVGAINRRRLIEGCLVDIAGGAQAVSELDFLRFCKRNGLPRPTQQVVRLDGRGRRRYLDAVLVGPTGRRVPVEIDGALHLVALTYWSDMARDNELWIKRSDGLRFPSFAIRADDPIAVGQLRRALGMREAGELSVRQTAGGG